MPAKGWGTGVNDGIQDTHLGPGNDGFIKVKSHVGAIEEAPFGYSIQVGREETVGPDEVQSGGRGKGK